MAQRTNRKIVLVKRPEGEVTPDCMRLAEEPVRELAEGEALVKNLYLSCDPTQQGWMKYDTYMPAIPIGDVIRSGGVGEVIESRSPLYTKGELVSGLVGWQEYAIADGGGNRMQAVPDGVSAVDAVSVFGITGLTAYFGLLDIGQPKAGETVVVSGGAGATGSVVGQIAKIQGSRVVGIAGTPEKCRWLTEELGFDACVNYKTDDVGAALRAACPQGIDVYFDNVGGAILDAVLLQINKGARIALCGAISTYMDKEPPPGPRHLMQLILKHGHMEGFLVLDYVARFPEALAAMTKWAAEGKLQNRVDVVDGIENAPTAFQKLFTGGNIGKLLVRVT
ncbi:MAG: NADP-dependent oxidoreductase [Myxococcota bacterium]